MSQSLTCALMYIKKGIPIFPVHKDKSPATKYGHLDATTNEKIVRQWFEKHDYGIGIPTGPLSGITVLDIDNKTEKRGFEAIKKIEKTYGAINMSVVQTTGGGGIQVFFKWVHPVRNATNFLDYKGVDIRGKGGYVVVPPSAHPSGNFYEWQEGKELWNIKDVRLLPETPDFIWREFMRQEDAKELRKINQKEHSPISLDNISKLLERLKEHRVDDRDSWLQTGMAIHNATEGSVDGLALWDSWSQQSDKYEAGECDRLWLGFDGDKGITIGTLVFFAEEDDPRTPAKSASVKGTLTQYAQSDEGYARMFADVFANKIKYNATRDQWLIWNGNYWEPDIKNKIYRLAIETAHDYQKDAFVVEDVDKRQGFLSYAVKLQNRSKIQAMLSMAQNQLDIATVEVEWNTNQFFVGCKNGVIDLRTGEHREGNPDDLISKSLDVVYDKDAKCPRWIKFIDEIFDGNKDVARYVQKAVGYTLTGSVKEQAFFMLIGNGRNGKSRFLEVILKMLGDYAEVSGFDTFERGKNSSIPNDIAKLAGCRLTVASEANQGGPGFNESRIKSLTGGEPTTARFLNKEFFVFTPEFKIWLAVNHPPKVRDSSNGFWRRLKTINFPVEFGDDRDDKGLKDKLFAEIPGILNWAIEGCLLWQKEGLVEPKAVKQATEEYREGNDQLADFAHEFLFEDAESYAFFDDLYRTYTTYCKSLGMLSYEMANTKAFRNQMDKKYTKIEVDGKRAYKGVKLVVPEPEPYDDSPVVTFKAAGLVAS